MNFWICAQDIFIFKKVEMQNMDFLLNNAVDHQSPMLNRLFSASLSVHIVQNRKYWNNIIGRTLNNFILIFQIYFL